MTTELMAYRRFATKFLLLAPGILGIACRLAAAQQAPLASGSEPAVREALHLLSEPTRFDAEYDYELTVDVRLLLFWTGKDDVGGGYIKIGHNADDPSLEIIRLLFGSDPARARGINRWGSGTEVAKLGSNNAVEWSAFLGFMKSSQGQSVGAMQQELADEKQQEQHRFEAVISRVDSGRAISTTVLFYSGHDYDFRELEPAERVVLDRVQRGQDRKFRTLDQTSGDCNRNGGFLTTVQELINEAVEGRQGQPSLCYIYNSRFYTLTLDAVRPVPEKTVRYTLASTKQKVVREYRDLEDARLHTLNHSSGQKTYFAVLLGTKGGLRGAPVQIDYQPNWWFRVILNLKAPAGEPAKAR